MAELRAAMVGTIAPSFEKISEKSEFRSQLAEKIARQSELRTAIVEQIARISELLSAIVVNVSATITMI
jgi:hypothetical protein